jgi:hypothetical protein
MFHWYLFSNKLATGLQASDQPSRHAFPCARIAVQLAQAENPGCQAGTLNVRSVPKGEISTQVRLKINDPRRS